MDTKEILERIEDWLDMNVDEDCTDFDIIDNIDSITIFIKE